MQSIRSSFAKSASRTTVRAARPAARPVKAMAFKVTLKTPSGEQQLMSVIGRLAV